MSKVVTEDTLFAMMKGYEDRMRRLEKAMAAGFGAINVAEYGVNTSSADNTALITEAINNLPAAGGCLQFGPGTFDGRIIVPTNKLVVIKGAGMDSTGGVYGTRIRKPSGVTNPVLQAQGTVAARCYLEVWDCLLDGRSQNGDVVWLKHVTDVFFQRVRVKFGAQVGFRGEELYNCHFSNMFVSNCGSGSANPALMLDGVNDNGVFGGCNGVYFTDCEWEGNSGTDIFIDGDSGTSSVSSGFRFANCKIETQDAGSYPLILLSYASRFNWSGGNFYLGNGTHRIYEQSSPTLDTFQQGSFDGVTMDSGGSWAGDYYVEHTRGYLHIGGGSQMVGLNPSSAYWHIGANVPLDGVQTSGIHFHSNALRFLDQRTNGMAGKEVRTVPIVRNTNGVNPTSELGTSQIPVNNLRDAQSDIVSGSVTAPANVLSNRPITVRARMSAAQSNNARLTISTLARLPGDSSAGANNTVGPTDVALVANTIKEFSGAPSSSVKPGSEVLVRLFRDGTHANDNLTVDLSVHTLEAVFEVAV